MLVLKTWRLKSEAALCGMRFHCSSINRFSTDRGVHGRWPSSSWCDPRGSLSVRKWRINPLRTEGCLTGLFKLTWTWIDYELRKEDTCCLRFLTIAFCSFTNERMNEFSNLFIACLLPARPRGHQSGKPRTTQRVGKAELLTQMSQQCSWLPSGACGSCPESTSFPLCHGVWELEKWEMRWTVTVLGSTSSGSWCREGTMIC